MSKKKSYMNTKNILSESSLTRYLLTALSKTGTIRRMIDYIKYGKKHKSFTKDDHKLLRNKSFSKALRNWDKKITDLEKHTQHLRKKYKLD